MEWAYINDWLIFTACFSLLLIVSFIMIRQSQYFFTKDVIVRKFSILELEMPASPTELYNLIKGLFELPPEKAQKSVHALKSQLRLDFLFMPLAYGSVFLLCFRVANKMQLQFGYWVFMVLAFVQVAPWIFDIIENNYLLGKIRKDVKETSDKKHAALLWMEVAKWGIALTALVCATSAICYFWLTGSYSPHSARYLLTVVIEIILFVFAVVVFLRGKKKYV